MFLAIGSGLLATGIFIFIDSVFNYIGKYSVLEQLHDLQRVKIYPDNTDAFKDVFKKYKGDKLRSVIFVGYTGDMATRNLQVHAGNEGISIEELKILVKHPNTVADPITINNIQFPGFPCNSERIEIRSGEADDSIREANGLVSKNFVQKFNVRLYYSLPSIRAVLINDEFGFLSIYRQHTTGDDLSGSRGLYMRMSKHSEFEKKLLENFREWFEIMWNTSISQ